MEVRIFIEGVIIGFVVAVPVGPIGLLCVNRALSAGITYGLLSGLGVATADAIAAALVALGLTLISSFLMNQQVWLQPMGGLFLCYVGIQTFLTRPVAREEITSAPINSLMRAYASTFLLTFSNPVTILSFVAIYAGWGIQSLSENYLAAAGLTAGVFIGSALWWFILSIGLLLFRKNFTVAGLGWVHRVSGVIISGFGFVILLKP